MFPGQDGCFCCSDPPDPPPPCRECYYCGGDQPGCQNSVCDSFIIEVEGFSNATNPSYNQSGCSAVGTACNAYNGTFVLERDTTIDQNDLTANCVYRSDEFTATVPVWLELNGQWCWECENVAVYYELRFKAEAGGVELVAHRSDIKLVRAVEKIPFATFRTNYEYVDILGNRETGWPYQLCNVEGISDFEQSSKYPLHMATYISSPDTRIGGSGIPGEAGLLGQASSYGGDDYGTTEGLFIGSTFNFSSQTGYPGIADKCNTTTQFDALPDPGDQFMKIGSPNWICCKDDSFDCDTVAQIATGALFRQKFLFWKINVYRCGT